MGSRRQFFGQSALALIGLSSGAITAEPKNPTPLINAKTQKAIEQGLKYLASNGKNGVFGLKAYHGNTAITSLAARAFLAGGHLPGGGRHGKVVEQSLRFVLSQARPYRQFRGFLHNAKASPHGPMYEHGFATLFLAEAHGMIKEEKLAAQLKKTLTDAVDLIVRSQNREGGWRYAPTSKDADLTVTSCQVAALSMAKQSGMEVPKHVLDRALKYVKRCQDAQSGGFRYQAAKRMRGQFGNQAFARTAAGTCSLLNLGVKEGEEIKSSLQYLTKSRPVAPGKRLGGRAADVQYFYGHYFAVQVMRQMGGDQWKTWYSKIRDELLKAQEKDGSWRDGIDVHYGTAMALLILQAPNNYLPSVAK